MFLLPLVSDLDKVHDLLLGLSYNVNKGKETAYEVPAPDFCPSPSVN